MSERTGLGLRTQELLGLLAIDEIDHDVLSVRDIVNIGTELGVVRQAHFLAEDRIVGIRDEELSAVRCKTHHYNFIATIEC